MKEITERQKETLAFLIWYVDRNGFCPTVREIADSLGVVVSTAQDHLHALQRKGYIEVTGSPRAIRIHRRVA